VTRITSSSPRKLVVLLALGLLPQAEAASAATTDPEVIIYRFPGVRDNGWLRWCRGRHGVSLHQLQRSDRKHSAGDTGLGRRSQIEFHFAPGSSQYHTFSTHGNHAYTGLIMNTGVVQQGTTAIAATSINIICTAMTIDASTDSPVGVALRGIRFSPIPGSQE
jgi:hypothetical protein